MNKKLMNKCMCQLTLLFSLLLMGCAAALVPESNDPIEKTKQAHQLLQLGRPIGALALYEQAYELSSEKNDVVGMGRAKWWIANLYKANYKGKFGLPNPKKAMEAHAAAGDLFHKAHYSINAAWNFWMAGATGLDLHERALGCELLQKAQISYDPNSIDKKEFVHSEDILKKIKDWKKQGKCDL